MIDFESQCLPKSINFGALQARIIIDSPVLDSFDMFIPFKEIAKYKLLRTDLNQYVPMMSEQEKANSVFNELAKELVYFEKLKLKNSLDSSLEPKAQEMIRKPKI